MKEEVVDDDPGSWLPDGGLGEPVAKEPGATPDVPVETANPALPLAVEKPVEPMRIVELDENVSEKGWYKRIIISKYLTCVVFVHEHLMSKYVDVYET